MMSTDAKDSEHKKIIFSNVTVTRKRNLFWGRQWRSVDIKSASGIFILHVLALFAPFTFSWVAFWIALLFYFLTGMLGITMCYHRLLPHHSFKLPKWLEYTCAYLGVQAIQRDPIYWQVSTGITINMLIWRKIHILPLMDFGLVTWAGCLTAAILWRSYMAGFQYQERNNVEDLKSQAFYRFIKRTYVYHIFGFAVLVYAWGGFPYLVWIMVYQVTFLINSACHIWGERAWNTNDLSRNNWWVAIVSFGEGWHNNHHAFEYSARHGLEWWQIDLTWYMICFLKSVGLATNVKQPNPAHKLKKSFASDCKFK